MEPKRAEQASVSNGKLRFDVYEADPHAGELRKYGYRIRLEDRPFRALLILLRHANEVVTREELQKQLWPADVFVDFDHGLNTAIAKIRRALNDSADQPRFVETVGRRGYRFVAEVVTDLQQASAESSSTTSPNQVQQGNKPVSGPTEDEALQGAALARMRSRSSRQLRLIVVMAGMLVLAVGVIVLVQTYAGRKLSNVSAGHPIQSLAVLPLENLSGDPGQEYFSDGMTDELITNLSKIKALRVASRTSVIHLKGTKKTMPEIAQELKVDAIVEGSVSRVGSQIRIRTQLIRAASDEHLWAASYTTNMQDILRVQSEIAQQVATEIRGHLNPQEQRSLAESSRPANPEAYEAYLKGRYYFNQFTAEGFKKSCSYFEEVIKTDPAYAPGYSAMADCYTGLSSWGLMPPATAMPKARAMAKKAIELDDALPAAHGVLGTILLNYDWDWPAAYAELQKAADLDPNNSDTHLRLVSYYRTVGRVDDAAREGKLAVQLDPVSPRTYRSLGWLYLFAGQYENAESEFKKCLEFDPNFPSVHAGLFYVYDHKKMFPSAMSELLVQARTSQKNDLAETLDRVYHEKGYEEARKSYFESELKDALKNEPDPFFAAGEYALLGNKGKALDYLELAYRQRSNYMTQLKVNFYFDGLRSEPRFQHLLERLRLAD